MALRAKYSIGKYFVGIKYEAGLIRVKANTNISHFRWICLHPGYPEIAKYKGKTESENEFHDFNCSNWISCIYLR